MGCGEGGCGACTVMVSSCDQGKLLHRSINACLCPLYAVEGMHVVTVEGMLLSSLYVARHVSSATAQGAALSCLCCQVCRRLTLFDRLALLQVSGL